MLNYMSIYILGITVWFVYMTSVFLTGMIFLSIFFWIHHTLNYVHLFFQSTDNFPVMTFLYSFWNPVRILFFPWWHLISLTFSSSFSAPYFVPWELFFFLHIRNLSCSSLTCCKLNLVYTFQCIHFFFRSC